MRRPLPLAAVLLWLAGGPVLAGGEATGMPGLDALGPESGRIWFSGCVLEADRYVSCKSAARGVLEAIGNPGDQTAGAALQTYVSDVFIEKGCAFEAPPESFRVNGVFLSFDSKAAKNIRCGGKPGALAFAPDGMALLDTLYFFSGGPAP
jgi:hypothetical protein